MGILVAPATPITVTIGPSVAVAIVGPVVVIAITVVTAIMSPGVSVIVGNLFKPGPSLEASWDLLHVRSGERSSGRLPVLQAGARLTSLSHQCQVSCNY